MRKWVLVQHDTRCLYTQYLLSGRPLELLARDSSAPTRQPLATLVENVSLSHKAHTAICLKHTSRWAKASYLLLYILDFTLLSSKRHTSKMGADEICTHLSRPYLRPSDARSALSWIKFGNLEGERTKDAAPATSFVLQRGQLSDRDASVAELLLTYILGKIRYLGAGIAADSISGKLERQSTVAVASASSVR